MNQIEKHGDIIQVLSSQQHDARQARVQYMRDYKLMLEQAISRASKASTQQIKVMGTMKHINENPIVNGI